MSDTGDTHRANRPSNGGLSVSGSAYISRKALIVIVGSLGGLGGFGVYKGVRAGDAAGEAKADAAQGKQEARDDLAQFGADVKEKLDPAAHVAAQAAAVATKGASECATKAEVEELRKALESLPLSGRRRWRGRSRTREPVRIEVPPETTKPLAAPPAPQKEDK